MASTQSDYDQIEAARNKVSELTRSSGETAAGAVTFRDDVMKNVRDARAARGITNLQEDFGNATERLAVGRSQIVDRNKGVLNPLTINQITDQERAQNLGTIAKIGQYEEQNAGTVGEAVQAGANIMQAQAIKIKAQADAAATELENLMAVVKQKQLEAQAELDNSLNERKFNEGVRQYDQSLSLEKFKANKSDGTGAGITYTPKTAPSSKPGSKPNTQNRSFSPPPMSAKPGIQKEYPQGSGVMWTSTGGGWK